MSDTTKGFADERFAHLVKIAYRGFSRNLQLRLRKESLLYGHWTLLRILWNTDGITQRQLSEQARVSEPTTFGALQAMEKLGYITRQKMGKQMRVFVTPKGAALKQRVVPAAEEVNRIALAGLPTDDLAITRRTLLAMIENLTADENAWLEADMAAGHEAPFDAGEAA
ncbi:MarR family winged helix-turn-helix transcriptional regulator [Massilia niastensis]|uniref:MarR family winged helix-turn-helix transcriptional regulator n=1 Tax=Massilia niastensis TaxID=544911 RepID=UPI00035FC39F|nr:MarR family transcriptional regulator [Massilia niastensis]